MQSDLLHPTGRDNTPSRLQSEYNHKWVYSEIHMIYVAILTIMLLNYLFLFSSYEAGIANAISSFKWRKIVYIWEIDISNI